MSGFANSLRGIQGKAPKPIKKKQSPEPIIEEPKVIEKQVIKEVVKEVEKIIYIKKAEAPLQISNQTNKMEIVRKKIPNTAASCDNFVIVPKRKVLNTLGKHVYLRIRPQASKDVVKL
jgi:hypothetical protein